MSGFGPQEARERPLLYESVQPLPGLAKDVHAPASDPQRVVNWMKSPSEKQCLGILLRTFMNEAPPLFQHVYNMKSLIFMNWDELLHFRPGIHYHWLTYSDAPYSF